MNVEVRATRAIPAAPDQVYRILADYRAQHPRILPKPWFESVEVQKGGVGEGTVVAVGMRVMGTRHRLVLEVSEPEPGRVLTERNVADGAVTTFTVEPGAGPSSSRVTIATSWPRKPGFRGWVESKVNPLVAERIYEAELAKLAEYAPRAE